MPLLFSGLRLMPALLIVAACTQERPRASSGSPDAGAAMLSAAEQVRRCYRHPRVPTTGRRITTRLLVRYAPDGALIGIPLVVTQAGVTAENSPYAGRMAEAASLAVIRCSPVRLPAEIFRSGPSRLYLTFSPGVLA